MGAAALAPARAAARRGARSRPVPETDVPSVPHEIHLRPTLVVPHQMAAPRAASPRKPPRGRAQTTAAAARAAANHCHSHHQPWTGARRRTGTSQAPGLSRPPLGARATCALGGERLEIGGHPAPASVGKRTTGGKSQVVGAAAAAEATGLGWEGPFRCMVRLPPATPPYRCVVERRGAAAAHTRALRVARGWAPDLARTHTPAAPIKTATGSPTRNDHGAGVEVAHHH